MSKIKPPHKPRGEPAKVTIGNLELQVKNLMSRCAELVKSRDEWAKMYNGAVGTIETLSGQSNIKDGLLEEQREQYTDLSDAYSRLKGWQDCAREILNCPVDHGEPS